MRTSTWLFAISAVAFQVGCFVVPKTVTTSRSSTIERSQPTVIATGALSVSAEDRSGSIVVKVQRERVCSTQVREVHDETTSTRADLATVDPMSGCRGSDCFVAPFVAAAIAPITLALSGIVTGIVVAASSDKKQERVDAARVERGACPIPVANLLVELVLPSGAVESEPTKDDGTVALAVPDSEPREGTAIVRVHASETDLRESSVAYVQPPDDLDRAMVLAGTARIKGQVVLCGWKHRARGIVTLQVDVGGDGAVVSAGVLSTPDAELGKCVAAAMRRASFPRTKSGASFRYPYSFAAGPSQEGAEP